MTNQNSDDNHPTNEAATDRRGAPTKSRKSPGSRNSKQLHTRVRDTDTKFGGRLLEEFRDRVAAKPLPTTKQERAATVTADIEQLLSVFPKATVKTIIEALAAVDPGTNWSTSGREIAAAIKAIKSREQSSSSAGHSGAGARPGRPSATTSTDNRPTDPAPLRHRAVMPPRSTTATFYRTKRATPGLFDSSSDDQ